MNRFPMLPTLAAAALGLVATSAAHATTIGLPVVSSAPHALWDTFADENTEAGVTITDAAPGSADTAAFTASLSATLTGGGMVTGSDDRIYNGAGPLSVAFDLTIDGTAGNEIDTLYLWLKFTLPDPSSGLDRTTFFSPTLNGVAATATQINAGTGEATGGQEMGVVQYVWTGLNLESGEAFSFSITSPASGHVSLDAIQIATVPEPTAMALLGIGGLAMLSRRR